MRSSFTALLALLLLPLIACHAAPPRSADGEAITHPAAPLAPAGASRGARAAGQRSAQALEARAKRRVQAVVDALPRPSRGFLGGLQGKRLRTSLGRVERDAPGPVLFVVLDTTRADHLSAFGYTRPTTPHLERLADEGVRFSRFYSNGAWTRPSITSYLTSRYRSEHGVEVAQPHLRDEQLSVAEIFQSAGYATVGIVGNQTVRAHYGFDQGFDRFEDVYDELPHNPPASTLVDRAIGWIDANPNPAWFMWLMVVDPHDPYTPEAAWDRWERQHRDRTVPVPAAEYPTLPAQAHIDKMVALYDGEILQMDAALGRLFAHLRERGLWDDLTVVVLADHGEAFGENLCFRHPYHLWEPNIHVPWLIKSPSLAGGEGLIEDRLFEGVDVAPTLLDLAGVAAPEGWRPSGVSAAAVLTGPITGGWGRTVFTEIDAYGISRGMARRGEWKFMRFEPTRVEVLAEVWHQSHERLKTANHLEVREYLFDLSVDPGEEQNLIAQRPEVAAALRELLAQRRSGAELPMDHVAPSAERADDSEGAAGADLDAEAVEDLKALGYVE